MDLPKIAPKSSAKHVRKKGGAKKKIEFQADLKSIFEGFGIPILEAFTYSVPVICSDTPIFKEIGGDSVCYFKTRDYFSLSKKIQFLIESKNERENLIKKGNHRIKKFSRKNFIGGYENIILNYHDK